MRAAARGAADAADAQVCASGAAVILSGVPLASTITVAG